MSFIPEKEQQILSVHAELIYRVVKACQNRDLQAELEPVFKVSEQNGWVKLIAALRKILKGSRDPALLNGLDEEDKIIVQAVFRGLQDPNTLPDRNAQASPDFAAPGLAQLIFNSSRGDVDALHLIANMAQQMTQAGGDMAILAARFREMIKGERDPNVLCERMSENGQALMQNIIAELEKMDKKLIN